MPSLNESPHKSNLHTFISITTAVLVAFLAAAAFVLSFETLRSLAALSIPARLTFLFPLVVDGFIIVASLAVLRGSLAGERTLYAWTLVAIFSALSIWFNVAHARANPLAQLIAAVPPVALLLAFELLMSQCPPP